MANVFSVNVYQINQDVMTRNSPQKIGFPGAQVLIKDCSGSPTRSLSSGYNVYGIVQTSDGTKYYCAETQAQLITLANA
jgi:hypothetical protein